MLYFYCWCFYYMKLVKRVYFQYWIVGTTLLESLHLSCMFSVDVIDVYHTLLCRYKQWILNDCIFLTTSCCWRHQCRLLFKQMMFDSCNDVKYAFIGEVYKCCKYINNHVFISADNGIIMCYNSSSGCIKLNKGFRPIRTYTDHLKVNTHPMKLTLNWWKDNGRGGSVKERKLLIYLRVCIETNFIESELKGTKNRIKVCYLLFCAFKMAFWALEMVYLLWIPYQRSLFETVCVCYGLQGSTEGWSPVPKPGGESYTQ